MLEQNSNGHYSFCVTHLVNEVYTVKTMFYGVESSLKLGCPKTMRFIATLV